MEICIVILCIAEILLLLYVSSHQAFFKYYTLAKTVCSLTILAVAEAGVVSRGYAVTVFHWFFLIALGFCVAGDILLGVSENKKKTAGCEFICGVLAFSAAHVMFCSAYLTKAPVSVMDLLLPAVSAVVVLLMARSSIYAFGSFKWPVFGYAILLGFMLTKALSYAWLMRGRAGLYIAIGSVLFFLSDIVLAGQYFKKKKSPLLRPVNLACYYTGIMLLAFSLWKM